MKLSLGPLIGAVSPTTANIWIRLDEQADFSLRLTSPADPTPREGAATVLRAPFLSSNVTFRDLKADTPYQVEIFDPVGQSLGSGSFRTLPIEPTKFSFTFASCHRPAAFYGSPSTYALWEKLANKMADPEFSRFHIQVGDQIYADPIYDVLVKELTDDPEAHLRAKQDSFRAIIASKTAEYVEQYRTHWAPDAVRRLLGMIPNFMIWDDHDIADGWGSRATSREDIGQALFQAAETAYRLFQDAHNPVPGQFPLAFGPSPSRPSCYGYGFTVGSKAGFLLPDQRSFRQTYDPSANRESGNHPIFGDQQALDLQTWLASDAAAGLRVLFFVATVPFFHSSPPTIGAGTDIGQLDALDNWIATPNQPELAFILDQLFAWKRKTGGQVVVLGGDVHMADVATIELGSDAIVQFVSSPITNRPSGGLLENLLVSESGRSFSLHGFDAKFTVLKHFVGRNFGRVTVDFGSTPLGIGFEVFAESAIESVLTAKVLDRAPWLKVTP
jgi:phosphodiesterase/alkaline phosphatase D-like protein